MNTVRSSAAEGTRLLRRITPLGAWALSFGCSVGWGAFVMPGTTFLPLAGPLGTALGVAVGALVMLIIGINYCELINRYPDAGGTFHYTKELFGYDHAFLSSWFLGLVYLAITWANATALPLIFRSLFGDLLCFGFHYTVAGYDVWLGEILLSLFSMVFFTLFCLRGNRAGTAVQTVMAVLLLGGVLAAFAAVFLRTGAPTLGQMAPLYSPDRAPAAGVLFIVFLAPWAFAGFESISHSAEEFKFSVKKTFGVIVISLATAALAYILLTLVAASAQPEGVSDWYGYVQGLGGQAGVSAIPTFFAIQKAAGTAGLAILGVAAAGGIITGFVGNMTAASRMIYAMARDELLPAPMATLNRYGAPKNAILFLALISLPIPFLGRSAIGWIVDVNTIGVVIAYAYTSAAAFKSAGESGRKFVRVSGALGVGTSLFFLFYFLVPNLYSVSVFSNESYFILLLWAVLGFVMFYLMFRRDRENRLGKSTMVWVVLLLLIFFTSIIWLIGTTENITEAAVRDVGALYANGEQSASDVQSHIALLQSYLSRTAGTVIRNSVLQFVLILTSILIIFRIYGAVHRQGQRAAQQRTVAEESSRAKSNFLSNMSHDIRTPMNAIIGYVTLAKRERGLTPKVDEYLTKIETSSGHLLALINDILEMSRIESGRVELVPIPTDLRKIMDEVRSLFSTQMETKGLHYTVTSENVTDAKVLCDRNRLNRVLLNLISNAYKFTPEGGAVAVTLRQTGREEGRASYTTSVKDSGIGMSPEFAAKVFEAYEREKTETVENTQGTGLGTAITKSIVELMGGEIKVFSEQGKGSEFVVSVSFPIDPEAENAAETERAAEASRFHGMRILLVEDNAENREVEQTLFEQAGFVVDLAENGEEAVECIAASEPGEYAAVLMDIEMPVKNGYDAAKLIRSLRNPALAATPIIALSAKAFSEDVAAAYAAGMNGHIAKPINMEKVMETMSSVLF